MSSVAILCQDTEEQVEQKTKNNQPSKTEDPPKKKRKQPAKKVVDPSSLTKRVKLAETRLAKKEKDYVYDVDEYEPKKKAVKKKVWKPSAAKLSQLVCADDLDLLCQIWECEKQDERYVKS